MMKRKIEILLVILYVLLAFVGYSQIPESFNYQGVMRNADGELITNQSISLRVSLLQGSETGNVVYSETHSVTTNDYGQVNLQIGRGDSPTSNFSSVDWSGSRYFLFIEMRDEVETEYVSLGASELLSVPYSIHSNVSENASVAQNSVYADTSEYSKSGLYALYSDTSNIARKLDNKILYFSDSDTLFAVKDRDGNIVFAVFPDGAKVYVNQDQKGKVGGFAVSGRSPSKSTEESIFIVTADSTRVFVTDDKNSKGKVGGFAVSGRSPSKSVIYDYFNISSQSLAEVVNPSQPRILWYPNKEAFLVGRVLIEHSDSVGLNSFATGYESKAIGDWSQALGYKSIARSDYATAIGKSAVANGLNSFAFGDEAQAISDYAFAIGSGARAVGAQSFALGSITQDTTGSFSKPPYALGDYSMAIGLGTKSEGLASVSLGANNRALGDFSTALGHSSTASGNRSITLGPYSTSGGYASTTVGYRNETTPEASFALAGGVGSKAYAYGAIAFGAYCHAYGARSVAMGDGCTTDGSGSVAMGKGSDALATGAIAFGLGNIADGVRSVAMGAGAFTNGMEGAFVFSGGVDKSRAYATRSGQVVFLGSGGLNFYASTDTAELNSFVIMPGSGNIGVGTFNPTEKMEISGGSLLMTEGNVILNGGSIIEGAGVIKLADYVFDSDYQLETIEKHAEFMWKNKHLPALRSADDIESAGGYDIVERKEQILEELEIAHIYIEQLNNKIKSFENENKSLIEQLHTQQNQIDFLISEIEKLKK